jgi:ABC-type nitrate/sulfonate/bicarbonate transport system ATPase subunit
MKVGPIIELDGICKSFITSGTRRDVLQSVNLSVDRGEFVSIVGGMGSGKSTLLNIAAGLIAPDSGSVRVGGGPVLSGAEGPLNAALVFQNYSLLPWFTALENVRLAVQAAFPKRSRAEQLEQARRSLELVGLGAALDRRPGQLSGGMRQRVAIARAFAIEPEILFLDEPFGALDALTRETLRQALAKLCAESRGVTTLMITNNVDEAILLSDRIVPMTQGPRLRSGQGPRLRSGQGPRATLRAPIPVPLARPRPPSFGTNEAALRVRTTVVEALTAC